MTPFIIADSSGLISLINEADANHSRASDYANRLIKHHGSLLIPTEVFAEIINVVGRKMSKTAAIKTGNLLLTSTVFVIADTDSSIREFAFALFQIQSPSVSFTDCIVMAVADSHETKEIFGFDEAFRKNGYQIV